MRWRSSSKPSRARSTCCSTLIRKQNFNVLDIPMADVTRQYLSYVDQIREHNLELAAEYLLMAAMLIEIKSRMLLPVKKSDHRRGARGPARRAGAPPARIRADEAGRAKARQAAAAGPRFQARARRWPSISVERVLPDASASRSCAQAWADIMKRARLSQHQPASTREQLSVRDHMTHILRRLNEVRFIEFGELFAGARVREGRARRLVVVVHAITPCSSSRARRCSTSPRPSLRAHTTCV